ncbi:hypothetical protein DV736_g2748, partial [Chaetothyriales sp. CBS 134916]
MSIPGPPSDPHGASSVFPTYLVPSVPFRHHKSRQASADSTSSTETTLSVGSASTAVTSVSTSSNPFTCPLTPVPISSSSSVVLPPDDKLLSGHSSHIHCSKCATDLCLTSQIISKGFTGRHGRAYLVEGSPSYARPTDAALPNTYQHKAVPRNLVTGQHTVSDISCAVCCNVLGWKYVEAKDEAQKYKVGKYILETKRIRVGVTWECDGDDGGAGGEAAFDEAVPLSQDQLRQLYDGPSPARSRATSPSSIGGASRAGGVAGNVALADVEFDSQDEDECEDIFAGVWSPQLALKRRQRRQDRLKRKIMVEKEKYGGYRSSNLDPEDEPLPLSDASSNEQESGSEFTGREHYQNVGKSKLRQPEQPVLGAKYGGDTVSRASLSAGHGLDPSASSASDNGFEEDEERECAQYNSQNELDSHSDASGEAMEGVLEDEDKEDDSDSLSEESQLGMNDQQAPPRPSSNREKLKQLNKSDSSAIAASLTKAVKAEVQKGLAIQKQQAIYDRLLDSRIKLQKALTASNDLALDDISGEEMKEAARKAETAALSLCSTIDSIRSKLDSTLRQNTASSSVKAKRGREADNAADAADLPPLWEKFKSFENEVFSERHNVLKKWSATTRAASTAPASDTEIIDMLDSQIATEAVRLSEAREQNALVYADDVFYQSLLRDLIASRDKSSASADAISAVPTKLHPSGSWRKAVDTRASKGRKIRYTVHEKLQNFMAPDDRTTWSEAARHEFFASLFGQQLLDENGIDAVVQDHTVDPQEASLRLFRSH